MRQAQTEVARRAKLLRDIMQYSKTAIFGSLSESYRTCGTPSCRCHREGPKHGPNLFVSWREDGKTRANYIPKAAESAVRDSVAAWWELQARLRELADMNKMVLLDKARSESKGAKG